MLLEDLIPGLNIEDTRNEFKGTIEEGKSEDSGKVKEIGWLKTIAAFANTGEIVNCCGLKFESA